MNRYQELWWQQAQSDYEVFALVRGIGQPQCHSLHYLQMATEKLAKAYFWREGRPRPKSHVGFVQFLRFLGAVRQEERERLAGLFSFNRFLDFQKRIKTLLPIAYDLERLAPSLANEGPNPEYPWPHTQPEVAPAKYNFPIWTALTSGSGRDLMRVVHIAIARFADYADV